MLQPVVVMAHSSLFPRRIVQAGLLFRRDKCAFLASAVMYNTWLIHKYYTPMDKMRAVQEALQTRSGHELKSYVGLLTYYSKFLPNLSLVLTPQVSQTQ